MPIHKDPSSPTSLKRKAEDNDDASESEQEDERKQGHKNKKAKPTSGYVPGQEAYSGTAKHFLDPEQPAPARALEKKSTNTSSKTHKELLKQDSRNLNRNAPKPKVPYGVGDPSSYHVSLANTIHVEG